MKKGADLRACLPLCSLIYRDAEGEASPLIRGDSDAQQIENVLERGKRRVLLTCPHDKSLALDMWEEKLEHLGETPSGTSSGLVA